MEILDNKLQEPYTRGICNSIIKIYNSKNCSYSIDDIKQDIIVYFITKDKLNKLRNNNGIKIAIEFYLIDVYRKLRGFSKSKHYDNLLFLKDDEIEKFKKIGFQKKHLLLHAYLYFNAKIRRLNLNSILIKNNKVNYVMVINEALESLSLVCDINKYDDIKNIYDYFKNNTLKKYSKSYLIPDRFWDLKNDGSRRRVDYRIVQYIKEIYKKEVDILFEN